MRTIHYGETVARRDYKAELAEASGSNDTYYCRRWECAHFDVLPTLKLLGVHQGEVDDGEDENGNPYPPCPMCYSGGLMQGLPEAWMGDCECIGAYQPRRCD